jgi:hypothetical protein
MLRTRLFLGATLVAASLRAQQDSAQLGGRVLDPGSAPVAGAAITLRQVDGGAVRLARSGADGAFQVPQLSPGRYEVRVEKPGFKTLVQSELLLRIRTPVTVDLRLQLGAVSESVTIRAEAPPLNLRDATIGNTFDGRQITELPLEARNVTALLSLQPGAVYLGENSPTRVNNLGLNDPDSRNGSVNGGRSDQANLTLDGIDVNDQQYGFAFQSSVRVLTEAAQEFRVVTSSPTADQGRSSGAQIGMVTRGGTNQFHGALFHSHRNTITTANDFFNNRIGAPRPKLIRNVFGAAAGAPIVRDRLFLFGAYEGRVDRSQQSVLRTVPMAHFREGTIRYPNRAGGASTLSPATLASLDPARIGVNAAALAVFRQYPVPNDPSGGDEINFSGHRFNSPVTADLHAYTARLDWSAAAAHSIFGRANLQDDRNDDIQHLPGQLPQNRRLNNSRGLAIGHTWSRSANLVNTARYGLTRFGLEDIGLQRGAAFSFGNGISSTLPNTRSRGRTDVLHQMTDDATWIKGGHTIGAGVNLRWIRLRRYADLGAPLLVTNLSYLQDRGGSLVPADLAPAYQNAFIPAALAMLGGFPQAGITYVYERNGKLLGPDEFARRAFATNEYEFYLQDAWRVRPNLTFTLGLRYGLASPMHEQGGNQVAPSVPLGRLFDQRVQLGRDGRPQSVLPPLTFDLSGPVNGRPGFYDWDRNNFAPRLAAVWSPTPKTAIRAGASWLYDRAGQASTVRYDQTGTFGLATNLITSIGSQDLSRMPRFQGLDRIPPGLLVPPPPFRFPFRPAIAGEAGNSAISFAPDTELRTPYTIAYNVGVQRELPRGFTVEASWVGRESRDLLSMFDVTMPLDLRDAASSSTYFTAARELFNQSGAAISAVRPIPYWENVFPGFAGTAARMTSLYGTAFTRANPGLSPEQQLTSTQVAHFLFNQNTPVSYANTLSTIDSTCRPSCSRFGPYTFFNDQFLSLVAWRSVAPASYHAMQFTARKRFSRGTQFDFNYTLSRARDWSSAAERSDPFNGSVVLNSYRPEQMRAPADFDLLHQWNANWIVELPFGKGPLLGGWQLSGIGRWTSGFPVSVTADVARSTGRYFRGFRTPIGETPATANTRDARSLGGGPNLFDDPAAAFGQFGITPPGETGPRNNLRGEGVFGLDFGLSKSFDLPWAEAHRIAFRWEVFNATNSVRFDTRSLSLTDQAPATFGRYRASLTAPRVMQFLLRYSF